MTTSHLSNLSVMEKSNVPTELAVAPSTVDYWVTLLRKNLSAAQDAVAILDGSPNGNNFRIDEEVMNAPRRRSARSELAHEIAAQLYPSLTGPLDAIITYEKEIVTLRSMVMDQRRSDIAKATERNASANWIKRIAKQGPWDEAADPLSLDGAPSLPMPVEQSDPESLAPFFAHLARNGTHERSSQNFEDAGHGGVEPYYNTELIEFEKGVLYADGRVDLCKMVTGPRNIGNLMDSLKPNTFSKHFLLGNNIIGPIGATAIASFINEYPHRFETWYLAGNCIDAAGFHLLVDAMVTSPAITNVWLKRNPLGPTAANDVFCLVTQSPNLRTLDLDQTELGDEGVAELFSLLAVHTKTIALRNVYLNACGIGTKACAQIGRFLASLHCKLESLYMSSNPIGQAVAGLTRGLAHNSSLERLSLQSCGLKDDGVIFLAKSLKHHASLRVLDIGQGYATEDLGMRYNWITDASAAALVDLIHSTPLQYLNLSYVPMSQHSLNKVLDAIINSSTSLLWFQAKPLVTGDTDAASVKAGQEYTRQHKRMRERLHANVKAAYGDEMGYERFESEHKRFLVSPKDVRLIDSVGALRTTEIAQETWLTIRRYTAIAMPARLAVGLSG